MTIRRWWISTLCALPAFDNEGHATWRTGTTYPIHPTLQSWIPVPAENSQRCVTRDSLACATLHASEIDRHLVHSGRRIRPGLKRQLQCGQNPVLQFFAAGLNFGPANHDA